ncbi:hypothetical protein D3C87_1620450 [compost metagenome]
MHCLGDPLPADNLFVAVDGRGATIAQAAGRGRGAFGHDQPGTGTLAVVFDHIAAGDRIGKGAAASHGSHDDAVGQLQFAQGDRFEQDAHFNSSASYCFLLSQGLPSLGQALTWQRIRAE